MKSPVQTPSPGRVGGPRPFLSDKAVIALCMIVTIIEGYNVIVFGSVVPLMLTDASLGIDGRSPTSSIDNSFRTKGNIS